MFKFSKSRFSGKSTLFRYVYFLLSACTYQSLSTWKRNGEPNPFVGKSYRRPAPTERIEFVDSFEDVLRSARRRSRVSHQAP